MDHLKIEHIVKLDRKRSTRYIMVKLNQLEKLVHEIKETKVKHDLFFMLHEIIEEINKMSS